MNITPSVERMATSSEIRAPYIRRSSSSCPSRFAAPSTSRSLWPVFGLWTCVSRDGSSRLLRQAVGVGDDLQDLLRQRGGTPGSPTSPLLASGRSVQPAAEPPNEVFLKTLLSQCASRRAKARLRPPSVLS